MSKDEPNFWLNRYESHAIHASLDETERLVEAAAPRAVAERDTMVAVDQLRGPSALARLMADCDPLVVAIAILNDLNGPSSQSETRPRPSLQMATRCT